jgi:nicotinate-nucleotide adenylyltransferase
LLVVHRADSEKALSLHPLHAGKWVDITDAPQAFAAQSSGLVSFLPVTPPDISSTRIREQLSHGDLAALDALPSQVARYIEENQLYQT